MGTKSKSTEYHLIVILTRGTDNATCHTHGLDTGIFIIIFFKNFLKSKIKI